MERREDRRQVIGVEISMDQIKVCRFDKDFNLLISSQKISPEPFMPGALTVSITQLINYVDPNCLGTIVGINFSESQFQENIDHKASGVVKGWENVPLEKWLKSRLKRAVFILRDNICAVDCYQGEEQVKNISKPFLICLGAAR